MSITRAFVHVAGPKGAGKTLLIEHLLRSRASELMLSVVRCEASDDQQRLRESAPKRDPELMRYRQSGAIDVARMRIPAASEDDEFWSTDLMSGYSHGVVIEGDLPAGVFADLTTFVCPALHGVPVLVPAQASSSQRGTKGRRESLPSPEELMKVWLTELKGRTPTLHDIERMALVPFGRAGGDWKAPRRRNWTVAPEVDGIERAGLVVVNVRTDADREAAAAMEVDVRRLRGSREIFEDVAGIGADRRAITFTIADLSNPRDPATRKALTRVRRTLRDAVR